MTTSGSEPGSMPDAGVADAPARAPMGTPFQQGLGISWEEIEDEPGSMAATLEVTDGIRGPAGFLEGGVIATLVDCAGAAAAVRSLGDMVATTHMTLSFLSPGRTGPVRAEGRVLRTGRRDSVVEVRVLDTGDGDRLMAVSHMAVRSLGRPLPEFPQPNQPRTEDPTGPPLRR